jgi:hypothetical protein
MKTKLLLIITLFIFIKSSAQENIIVNGNYFIDSSINLSEIKNREINTLNENDFLKKLNTFIGKRYRLSIKAIEGDIVYFKFWEFSNDKFLNEKINGTDNEVIYQLSKSDFERLTKVYYDRFEWRSGVYTVPFKLRLSDFDFDANVNLGVNIGAKIRWKRERKDGFALEPIFGFGLASIKLDQANSKTESPTNVSAFSTNLGLLIHINSDINLGLVLGYDFISNHDQQKYDWKYNGKGWLGIGINIAFSKGTNNTENVDKNK